MKSVQAVLILLGFSPTVSFTTNAIATRNRSDLSMAAFGLFGSSGSLPRIPSSPSDRDSQAINSVKAAIASPKTTSLPLIECEFPPLQSLNKLGDGSLRSSNEVDQANLSFSVKLLRSIAPLPIMGPKTWLLTSSTASMSFLSKAKASFKGGAVHSLKDGLPDVGNGDVCVLVAPCIRNDYDAAQRLSSAGTTVVLVNGVAKDAKSVPAQATMAYFLKPLTYNSQVVGYLARAYPGQWATIDAVSNEVLKTFDDSAILVRGTNTPDLRESGKLVQKSVDERAIRARRG